MVWNSTQVWKRQQLSCLKYYSKELAQLLGVICGDGTLDGNRIIIYEGKKKWLKNMFS